MHSIANHICATVTTKIMPIIQCSVTVCVYVCVCVCMCVCMFVLIISINVLIFNSIV